MPETGITYLPKKTLLSFEETSRVVRIAATLGISKIRITGGEPFVRNDLMELIKVISRTEGVKDVHITTNGVLTQPFIPQLKQYNVRSVNLSLDTLDRERFKAITQRDEFEACLSTLSALRRYHIPVKVNTVVMDGKNIDDLIPIAELSKNGVSVRFIEEMPFNGTGSHYQKLEWNYQRILEHLQSRYPDLVKVQDESNSTSINYRVPGYTGTIGIIPAFSRTFCGTCNRIRLTAQGTLKTCLYDNGVLDIRSLLRSGATDDEIRNALLRAFRNRAANGYEAEQRRPGANPVHESMSTIGG